VLNKNNGDGILTHAIGIFDTLQKNDTTRTYEAYQTGDSSVPACSTQNNQFSAARETALVFCSVAKLTQ